MPGEPTVIYSAANPQQAYLLKGLLEERGIAAWVVNDSIQIAGGELPLGWSAAARVVVGQKDAEEARQFALEFDQRTAHDPQAEAAPTEPPAADWTDWPLCPSCQQRRSARCPVCGVSGTQFPLADIQETDAGERVLLFCEACDDHFLPQWHRYCPRCGHDYGDGIDVGRPPQWERTSPQTWIVLAGLALGCLALVAYFVWLFRQ